MEDVPTSEVDAKFETSQHETIKFGMLIDLRRMDNFNNIIYIKTLRTWRAVEI
jgi:hypothetical protein